MIGSTGLPLGNGYFARSVSDVVWRGAVASLPPSEGIRIQAEPPGPVEPPPGLPSHGWLVQAPDGLRCGVAWVSCPQPGVARLEQIWLSGEHRGAGVGSALVERICRWLRDSQEGLEWIEAELRTTHNQALIPLLRNDFSIVGMRTDPALGQLLMLRLEFDPLTRAARRYRSGAQMLPARFRGALWGAQEQD